MSRRSRIIGSAIGIILGAGVLGFGLRRFLQAHPPPTEAAGQSRAKPEAGLPEMVDITASTGIRFHHLASPDKKYIVESDERRRTR